MPITEENQEISSIDYMEYIETNIKCKVNMKPNEKIKIDFKSARRLNDKIQNMEQFKTFLF